MQLNRLLRLALALLTLTSMPSGAAVLPGATVGSLTYQGRLEKDRFPVTGAIQVEFKLFNAPTAGTQLWASGLLNVSVLQGIFGTTLAVPEAILAQPGVKYLQVQAMGQILLPREPLHPVPYAYVAKDLEERNLVIDSELLFNVTTGAGAVVRTFDASKSLALIGAQNEAQGGSVKLFGNGAATNAGDVVLQMGGATSNMLFRIAGPTELMRLRGDGRVTIGTTVPADVNAKLTVHGGDVWIGHEADGTEGMGTAEEDLFVKGNVIVDGKIIQHEGDINSSFDALGIGGVAAQASEYLRVGPVPTVVVSTGGQVAIGTSAPYLALTVQGSIGFKNGSSALLMNGESGTNGNTRMFWSHSPNFPQWGLRYDDVADRFITQSDDATPDLHLNLDTSEVIKLDSFGRIRVRQLPGQTGAGESAGIWLFQQTPNADRAFLGMEDDDKVGIFSGPISSWLLSADLNFATISTLGQLFVGGADVRLGLNDTRNQGTVSTQRALSHCDTAGCGAGYADDSLVINFGADFEGETRVDGKLGVGETPSARLQVNSAPGEDGLRVRIAGTTKLYVEQSGGVAIGTLTTPDADGLYVEGPVQLKNVSPVNGQLVCLKGDGRLGSCQATEVFTSGSCTCQ